MSLNKVSGQFMLGLKKFFDLPNEPAQYRVQAKLDTYLSEALRFAVVK
jgi:hypothetical protein